MGCVDQLREKHIGLVLLASPSLGSAWANIAGRAADYYNQRLGSSLRVGDGALGDIHERFKELLHRRALPHLKGVEAAEHQMVFRNKIPQMVDLGVLPLLACGGPGVSGSILRPSARDAENGSLQHR